MNKLKAIKIIVFILTFMLVFGVLSVLGMLFKKTNDAKNNINKEVFLDQPLGSNITNITHNNKNTYILITGGGVTDRILMLDANNNAVSKIYLNGGKND